MRTQGAAASHRDYEITKRALDIIVAAGVLIVTSPLQAVLAVLVARNLGLPVLFRQQRPGRHSQPFTLVKFRTMRQPERSGGLVSDADRLTRFGVTLRRTSLDELPTFWNVLRGDMSLVGPRPLLMSYLDRYTPEQARRHDVRPGITGLAQVSGRNALTWEAKFAADRNYVRRRSLRLDVVILWRTVLAVVRRSGIAAEGVATMPEFMGSVPDPNALRATG